jgi:hypothetical protein
MAICLYLTCRLTEQIREQAHSYNGFTAIL